MKTNRLVLMAATLLFTGAQIQAQNNVVGLQYNENSTQLDLVTVSPESPEDIQVKARVQLSSDKRYMPNTLTHIEDQNTLYFFTQSDNALTHGFTNGQQLEVANATTGEILRSLPFVSTTLIAPFIIPDKNQIGFIATERSFNSYGNNDDNIALVLFNMNSGEIAHRIELPSLSLSAVSTPFVGKLQSKSINGIGFTQSDASISSPCYIGSSNTLLFAAKDVMGINRLYRFDLTKGTLISKTTLDVDVLDMTYDEENSTVKALYIETVDGSRALKVGDLSLFSNVISNSSLVRNLKSTEEEINDGELELDPETQMLTVIKADGKTQWLYNFDTELNLVASHELKLASSTKVDIEFPTPIVTRKQVLFEDLVKLYPNPAVDVVTIETEDVSKVSRITVYNNIGEEVKDVDVQSGLLSNSINVSSLKPGIYMVEIQSSGIETVTKKLVVQ